MNNRIVRIGLMSVAVAALVVIGIVLLVGRGTGAQLTPSSAQALTPQNATPARSDAGTLVFSRYSFRDQTYDLYLVRSDGTGLRRLTTSPAVSEEYAHWSPDGARVVYTEGGRGGASVWVRNADGSGKFHVAVKGGAQGSSYGWSLGWSPNGKQILSAHDEAIKPPFSGLRVVNADGSGWRVVSGVPSWPHFATWAPNGKIVFVRVRSDRAFRGGDLFVANPDGSGLQRLTKGAWLTSPSVSPDASTIVAYATTADRLIAMPFRRGGGHTRTLLTHASRYFPKVGSGHYHPNVRGTPVIVNRWSPDGKKLVLGSDDSWGASQPQYIDPKAGAALYIVNADGSGFTRVPGVTDAIDPDWRP